MMGCIPFPMSGKHGTPTGRRRVRVVFCTPCAAAMETDPTKLGTMKLMGTFGVPSYTSFGDEYMKKIGAAHRFLPSCSAPAG